MGKDEKLVAVVIITTLLIISSSITSGLKQKNSMQLIHESKQFILHIDADDHYDYGYKAGKKYFFFYKFLDLITKTIFKVEIKEGYAEETLENLSTYSPWVVEELQGLANSTNIEIKNLLSIFYSITSVVQQQCTVVLATGNATKNNETFLAQNFDVEKQGLKIFFNYFIRAMSHVFVIADIQTENYSYVFYGIPVFYEIPLMNQEGLGYGANQIVLTENNTRSVDKGSGVSTYNLERLTMMRCKNISEVQKLWINTVRSSGRNRNWPYFWDDSTPSFCDKNGDILTIEQTHNYLCFVYRNSTDITKTYKDILWHTNHHMFLNPDLTGSIYPDEGNIGNSSFLRAERAIELLEENHGNITVDIIKTIMRDHNGGTDKNKKDSSDICCHPDQNSSYITVLSWIIQPQKMRIYLTHDTPDKTRYRCITLDKEFFN